MYKARVLKINMFSLLLLSNSPWQRRAFILHHIHTFKCEMQPKGNQNDALQMYNVKHIP